MRFILLFLALNCLASDYVRRSEPFSVDAIRQKPVASGLNNSLPTGILDPSKLSMSQSYSMSYSTNGEKSDMTGLYLNRLRYDFDVPLTLQVDVGLFHKPLALVNESKNEPGVKSAALTIPHASLTWAPSEKFMMSFEYFQTPAGYTSYNGFMPYDLFNPSEFGPVRKSSSTTR